MRPPQPLVIVVVIDISAAAVNSGMVAVAANAILESLSRIPDSDGRAKIGFITFDGSIQLYNLKVSVDLKNRLRSLIPR